MIPFRVAGRGWRIEADAAVPLDLEDPERSTREPLAGRVEIDALPLALLFVFGIALCAFIFFWLGPRFFETYWFEKSLFTR